MDDVRFARQLAWHDPERGPWLGEVGSLDVGPAEGGDEIDRPDVEHGLVPKGGNWDEGLGSGPYDDASATIDPDHHPLGSQLLAEFLHGGQGVPDSPHAGVGDLEVRLVPAQPVDEPDREKVRVRPAHLAASRDGGHPDADPGPVVERAAGNASQRSRPGRVVGRQKWPLLRALVRFDTDELHLPDDWPLHGCNQRTGPEAKTPGSHAHSTRAPARRSRGTRSSGGTCPSASARGEAATPKKNGAPQADWQR